MLKDDEIYKFRVIEDIQKANSDAGGSFKRQDTLLNMRVYELLDLLIPNKVEFSISHNPNIVKK